MDKVQIYVVVSLCFNGVAAMAYLATKNFKAFALQLLTAFFAVPVYGRIFGWW